MYSLSIQNVTVKGSITFSHHDTWDECYDELMTLGKWKYVGCFGMGICEFEQGDLLAHIYRR